jgi:hypothetical protein
VGFLIILGIFALVLTADVSIYGKKRLNTLWSRKRHLAILR